MSAISRQRGASLITAIFLITIVASLAALGVQLNASQRQTANFGALGDRAHAAAQSGIEWGAYRALNGNCVGGAGTNVNLTEGALNGFSVQVWCVDRGLQNDCPPPPAVAVPYRVWDITAHARWGAFGSAEYTSRQLSKRFTNASC